MRTRNKEKNRDPTLYEFIVQKRLELIADYDEAIDELTTTEHMTVEELAIVHDRLVRNRAYTQALNDITLICKKRKKY